MPSMRGQAEVEHDRVEVADRAPAVRLLAVAGDGRA